MMSMLKNNNDQKSLSVQMATLHQRWQQIRQLEQQIFETKSSVQDSRPRLVTDHADLYSTV